MKIVQIVCTSLFLAALLVGCSSEPVNQTSMSFKSFSTLGAAEATNVYKNLDTSQKIKLWQGSWQAALKITAHKGEQEALKLAINKTSEFMKTPEKYGQKIQQLVGDSQRVKQLFTTLGSLKEGTLHQHSKAKSSGGISRKGFSGACDTREGWGCGCKCSKLGRMGPLVCRDFSCTSNCVQTASGCGWFWSQACTRTVTTIGPEGGCTPGIEGL